MFYPSFRCSTLRTRYVFPPGHVSESTVIRSLGPCLSPTDLVPDAPLVSSPTSFSNPGTLVPSTTYLLRLGVNTCQSSVVSLLSPE